MQADKNGCLLVVGGFYPGLALAGAVAAARQNIPVAIIHRTASARPSKQVEDSRVLIELNFSKRGWKLESLTLNDLEQVDINQAVHKLATKFNGIRAVLMGQGCNAYPLTDMREVDAKRWQSSLNRDFNALMRYLESIIPIFRRQKNGRIIALSYCESYWNNSIRARGGDAPFINNLPFVLNNQLLSQLQKHMFLSLLQDNISFNTIELGAVVKATIEGICDGVSDHTQANQEDFAHLFNFLLSKESARLSGATLPLLSPPKRLEDYYAS